MEKKKLIHIHVGKCAGSSINMALHRLGLPFTELHCGNAPQELNYILDCDDGSNIYIISYRDPIARIVSAFNWDKYEKIISQRTSNIHWNDIYNTFSSINHLAESLEEENEDKRKLAKFALSGSSLHMHLGLSWYIPEDIAIKLPINRVSLVRTENLLPDFNAFIQCHYPSLDEITELPKDKDSKEFLSLINIDNPRYLSNRAKENLRKNLEPEYIVLNFLEKKKDEYLKKVCEYEI
ncbi:hypothetical protein [Vibrio alfacsensis]|uniref:hypothetical protein n=1 Tax=Vibrio alfacsensis TaxID=1074311 RepID=UPI004068402E